MSNIFKLPPAYDRHVGGISRKYLFPDFDLSDDDGYIYYLIMKAALLLSMTFSVLYLATFLLPEKTLFDLLGLRAGASVEEVTHSYCRLVSLLLFSVLLPYAWALFHFNVDLNKCDLLRHNRRFAKERETKNGWAIIKTSLSGALLCPLVPVYAWLLPPFLQETYRARPDSPVFLAITLSLLPFINALALYVTVMSTAIFIQHIRKAGPFYQ